MKIIWSRSTAKNLSEFANFPAKIFLSCVRKSICTAPFLDFQELYSWSTLKANVCTFLYISVRNFLFQTRSKILVGAGLGRLNNFFKVARCLILVKCLTIFHFNLNFWKFNYFSICNIKTLKPSRQFGFQFKTVAKFLIRSHFLSK